MSDKSYKNYASMTDSSLMKIIGGFIKHHRLNQNKSQDEVAGDANISRSTLSGIENGGKATLNSLMQVLRVLDLLYVLDVFKIETEISPIAYAKMKQYEQKRVRHSKVNEKPNEDLGW